MQMPYTNGDKATPSFYQASHAHTAQGSPAYTAVNARTTLSQQTPSQHTHPTTTASSKIEWPQAVREYVSRAFIAENMIQGIERMEMTVKLKQVITEAAENHRMDLIDWSTHPLPQQLIYLERSGTVPPPPPVASGRMPFYTADVTARKRKSSEPEVDHQAPQPPWRQGAGLADRIDVKNISRQDKKQKRAQEFRSTAGVSKYNDLEKRKQRFETSSTGNPYAPTSRDESPVPSSMDGPIVGTCQSLEKSYFRLTAPPKAETVRPLEILKKTLDFLVKKWKKEHNYAYICDQFKSLRQDLTVQHIKNEFTVRVYEAHARIALEKGDLGEYNQCQTQLRALYKLKLGGRPGEFTAYRVLYFVYTCNRTSMSDMLSDLTLADKQHPAVKHALDVRSSLARGNYHRFFKLYEDPPNMGGYLMDMFVERERLAALANMCRAYKPDLRVDFLTAELAFADDQQCAQFICEHGSEQLLQNRDDGPRFMAGQASAVFEAARQKAFAFVDIKGQI